MVLWHESAPHFQMENRNVAFRSDWIRVAAFRMHTLITLSFHPLRIGDEHETQSAVKFSRGKIRQSSRTGNFFMVVESGRSGAPPRICQSVTVGCVTWSDTPADIDWSFVCPPTKSAPVHRHCVRTPRRSAPSVRSIGTVTTMTGVASQSRQSTLYKWCGAPLTATKKTTPDSCNDDKSNNGASTGTVRARSAFASRPKRRTQAGNPNSGALTLNTIVPGHFCLRNKRLTVMSKS